MRDQSQRATRVREILAGRGLSLYQVSQRSADLFGRSSRFYIPHNLYSEIERTAATPTIHQIVALSRVTNFLLIDWLAAFGIDLDVVFATQVAIPRQRTVLFDSKLYDENASIPWFAAQPSSAAPSTIVPLRSLMAPAEPQRAGELAGAHPGTFLYARIGGLDAYARPSFVPGSIVRADRRLAEAPGRTGPALPGRFYLLEHDQGWACAQLVSLGGGRVRLLCPQLPCAEREITLGTHARVLGAIDAEIRPLNSIGRSGPLEPEYLPIPNSASSSERNTSLDRMLRAARRRVGLSFREASALSRFIAQRLSDGVYFAAASTLSDYEVLTSPPRQVQKLLTLCLLYAIPFEHFLNAAGLPLDAAGRESIPDAALCRQPPAVHPGARKRGQSPSLGKSSFVADLGKEWEEMPLFLRPSLGEITGLPHFSISDVFWLGGQQATSNPLLANARLAVVNRRSRNPPREHLPFCRERLYLLLKRDGSYACGYSTLEDGILTLRDAGSSAPSAQRFRESIDAEIVGRVTALVRRLR